MGLIYACSGLVSRSSIRYMPDDSSWELDASPLAPATIPLASFPTPQLPWAEPEHSSLKLMFTLCSEYILIPLYSKCTATWLDKSSKYIKCRNFILSCPLEVRFQSNIEAYHFLSCNSAKHGHFGET